MICIADGLATEPVEMKLLDYMKRLSYLMTDSRSQVTPEGPKFAAATPVIACTQVSLQGSMRN